MEGGTTFRRECSGSFLLQSISHIDVYRIVCVKI